MTYVKKDAKGRVGVSESYAELYANIVESYARGA